MKKRLTPADHSMECKILDTGVCHCYDDYDNDYPDWDRTIEDDKK